MSHDPIGRLAADQRAVRDLLDELVEHDDNSMRSELLQRVERELDVHARIKQEVIHPALVQSGGGEDADRQLRVCEEHYAVERMLLPDLKRTEPGTPEFAARVRAFREMLEQHAREEDDALFERARSQLTPEQLDELGRSITARRAQLR
ncbi:MAG: hemerythrin domain-containing protein [Halofilum sp. (in: g-proteobacteria)]